MIVSRRAVISAVLMFPIFVAPLAAQTLSIAGEYDIAGIEPDGSEYTGSVVVQQNEAMVRFIWDFDGEISRGTGEIVDDIVTVHYGESFPAIYKIVSETELLGTYENGTGIENLYRR